MTVWLPRGHRVRGACAIWRRSAAAFLEDLTKGELQDLLAAAREHQPDAVLLILTGHLTANVRDWLESVRPDYRFQIHMWEARNLQKEISRFRDRLTAPTPKLNFAGEPTFFYEVTPAERVFMCNEVSEVGFVVVNSTTNQEAIDKIRTFVEYVRNNRLDFLGERELEDEGA